MKLALLSMTIGAACAFAPSNVAVSKSALRMSETEVETVAEISTEEPAETVVAAPSVAAINGWVPDETKPCYGLPGKLTLIHRSSH